MVLVLTLRAFFDYLATLPSVVKRCSSFHYQLRLMGFVVVVLFCYLVLVACCCRCSVDVYRRCSGSTGFTVYSLPSILLRWFILFCYLLWVRAF